MSSRYISYMKFLLVLTQLGAAPVREYKNETKFSLLICGYCCYFVYYINCKYLFLN